MLTWNVYVGNFNRREIEVHNVFQHGRFCEYCQKLAREHKDDKAAFAEQLRRELMYYYWSKCEWEVIITGWPPSENYHDAKIDVYDQVLLNWDVFLDYVWAHRDELAKRPRKSKTAKPERG